MSYKNNFSFNEPKKVDLSRVLGILSLIATVCTAVAAVLDFVNPEWAVIALAISAGISAFTSRVQGNRRQ